MNLYLINNAIVEAYENAVDEETGEIIDIEAYNAIGRLQMAKEEKLEQVALFYKNTMADIEELKKEKQYFAERQAKAERKAESLKNLLSNILLGEKFQTNRVVIGWRKSETVEYTGTADALPEKFLRFKAPELDKTELKKALKAGETIEGASLVTKNNIQIK